VTGQAQATAVRARIAVRRLPLLAGAVLSLVAGLWGGLGLLGTGVPLPRAAFAGQHGPLMALGFLGTLISLERAVALGRAWGHAAPALAGVGAIAAAAGLVGLGRLLLTVAAAWLIAVYLVLLGRRPDRDIVVQLSGAVAWYAGGLLWIRGRPIADLVPWLMAFLVLTIAGERLELARLAFLRRRVSDGLLVAAALVGAGVVLSVLRPDAGWRLAGLGMVALTGWLAVNDVARRTVRGTGLPRYAAVCLLAGYVWLAAAGVIWVVAGRAEGGGGYDAALHAVFLGFAMSMVFGHAPVILPAILRVRLPYHRLLYAPLAVLHVGLLVRIAGDLGGVRGLRMTGGVLDEIALLAFGCCAAAASRLSRPRKPS
jgi:hypothetical protein